MRTGMLAIAATAIALAACSSDAPKPAGYSADNMRVCQHYAAQRVTLRNLAEPSVADVLKAVTWIAADAAEATPGTPLSRDLNALSGELSAIATPGARTPAQDSAPRVAADCKAIGVTVTP